MSDIKKTRNRDPKRAMFKAELEVAKRRLKVSISEFLLNPVDTPFDTVVDEYSKAYTNLLNHEAADIQVQETDQN